MTSQPIRLSTNFMTLIPSLTFTELWVVSIEHLQRVWHASKEHLPFRTPGSVHHFGTCLCSYCWNQIPRPCHVFTRLFTLNTPWHLLDLLYGVFVLLRLSLFVFFGCLSYDCFRSLTKVDYSHCYNNAIHDVKLLLTWHVWRTYIYIYR